MGLEFTLTLQDCSSKITALYIKLKNEVLVMRQKLLEYGFSEDQIKALLKKKKLDTVHGTYTLVGNELILKQGKNVKKVDL